MPVVMCPFCFFGFFLLCLMAFTVRNRSKKKENEERTVGEVGGTEPRPLERSAGEIGGAGD